MWNQLINAPDVMPLLEWQGLRILPGLTAVTGDEGSGKTRLLRELGDALPDIGLARGEAGEQGLVERLGASHLLEAQSAVKPARAAYSASGVTASWAERAPIDVSIGLLFLFHSHLSGEHLTDEVADHGRERCNDVVAEVGASGQGDIGKVMGGNVMRVLRAVWK